MEHLDTIDCSLPDAQAIDSFTLQMTQFNRNPGLRLRNAQTAESFEILDQPWIQAIIFVLSSLPSFLPSIPIVNEMWVQLITGGGGVGVLISWPIIIKSVMK